MKLTFSFTIRFERPLRGADPEPVPEGNNFAQAEHAHSYTSPPELIAGAERHSIDDDFGAGRSFPIGFRRS